MPEALPAVTVPALSKAGRSLARLSSVAPSRMYSSSETTVSPFLPLMVTGTISSLNLPAFLAASALFCEATANLSCSSRVICHWRGDVLGRGAHVIAVEGVPQAVLDHGVDEVEVAHLGAVAQVRGVLRLAHALLAAGDDDGRGARLDLLSAERDGAQARAANLVDAPGRAVDRNAGGDRRLAGRVLALAGRQDLAEDDLGDVARLHAGALDGRLDGDLSELVAG